LWRRGTQEVLKKEKLVTSLRGRKTETPREEEKKIGKRKLHGRWNTSAFKGQNKSIGSIKSCLEKNLEKKRGKNKKKV